MGGKELRSASPTYRALGRFATTAASNAPSTDCTRFVHAARRLIPM